MSADNTMVIQKRGSRWHVWMMLGDENAEPGGGYHKMFTDELAAHHYAHEVCDTEYVEYGVVHVEDVP